jgi:hypothetical protein
VGIKESTEVMPDSWNVCLSFVRLIIYITSGVRDQNVRQFHFVPDKFSAPQCFTFVNNMFRLLNRNQGFPMNYVRDIIKVKH